MAYQFTKSKSRELQEWIVGQIREVLPDESISIFRALKATLKATLRRRSRARASRSSSARTSYRNIQTER